MLCYFRSVRRTEHNDDDGGGGESDDDDRDDIDDMHVRNTANIIMPDGEHNDSRKDKKKYCKFWSSRPSTKNTTVEFAIKHWIR